MNDRQKNSNVDWVGTFVYAVCGLAVLAALAIVIGSVLLRFAYGG